jgi:hypothetical protein
MLQLDLGLNFIISFSVPASLRLGVQVTCFNVDVGRVNSLTYCNINNPGGLHFRSGSSEFLIKGLLMIFPTKHDYNKQQDTTDMAVIWRSLN